MCPSKSAHDFFVLLALLLSASRTAAIRPADFVVIGGGTAGCTVAARLCTQLPSATVALVERGAARDPTAQFHASAAGAVYAAWGNPNLTQAFSSAPNPALAGNRTSLLLQGANLGGGSAITGSQLMLPPTGTFARWRIANLSDARAENLFRELRAAQPNTGVPSHPLLPTYTAEWLRAAAAADLPFADDPYAPPRAGNASYFARLAFDRDTGRRVDACATFLRPARAAACARRLRVVRGARAERLLFSGGRVARSVVLSLASGRKARLHARREVLLAAGAMETAALLLRSGVGPAAALARLGSVPRLVMDLPVGRALHSRALVTVTSAYGTPLARENDPAALGAPEARAHFVAGRGGALAALPFGPRARYGDGLGYGGMSVGFPPPALGTPLILTYCGADTHPRSFGAVALAPGRGDTAATPPVVELRLMQRAEDVKRMARCVQRVRLVHKRLAPLLNASEIVPPGTTAEELDTDEGIVKKVLAEADTAYHYVGTCAVGKVLDERLRVLQLQRVRVVDSAAIPLLPPSSGPMASVYVVAMHAADLVAKDHQDLS